MRAITASHRPIHSALVVGVDSPTFWRHRLAVPAEEFELPANATEAALETVAELLQLRT
jgi:hypothetical protein